MTDIDEHGASSAERNWKKIGLITGGVLLVLAVIGSLAGDPEEEKVAATAATTAEQVTTTKAPTTTAASTTTESPTTTAAPTTTEAPATTAPPPPPTTAPPTTLPPTTEGPFAGETVSQRNARQKATDYLDFMSFSRSGLIDQLVYEGFPQGDAVYGVDALSVDWNAQAAKKAAEYLDFMSFSRSGLIEQLVYEGFTQGQAEYGVGTTGL